MLFEVALAIPAAERMINVVGKTIGVRGYMEIGYHALYTSFAHDWRSACCCVKKKCQR